MKTRFHYAFVVAACCCLMMGVNVGLTFSCAGIFYKPVCADLGLETGRFGLYMAIMYVASALTLPLAGDIIARYGARRVFTAASVINGAGLAMMGCVSSLAGFYAAGTVLGISIAFLLYMSYPTLINAWFASRIGLMTGICVAASGIGGIIFNPVGAAIITSWGWRAGYWAFAAIVLLGVTPLLGLLLRDSPQSMGLGKFGESTGPDMAKAQVAATGIGGMTLAAIVRRPVFYVLLLFAFIMMGCSTLNLFIPGLAQSNGFSLESASLAAAASMTGVTLGKLALGWINDRNCLAGVLLCTFGGAVGIALMLAFPVEMWVLAGGCFLFGWCYAGVTVQSAMLTRRVAGPRDYARIFSYISVALSAGGAVASGAWGLIADAWGYNAAFGAGIILLALAGVLGIWALVSQRGRSSSHSSVAGV